MIVFCSIMFNDVHINSRKLMILQVNWYSIFRPIWSSSPEVLAKGLQHLAERQKVGSENTRFSIGNKATFRILKPGDVPKFISF